MRNVKSLLLSASFIGVVAIGPGLPADAAAATRVSGTRFDMSVPDCWTPGYKDIDEKLFMIYFTDPKSGAVLEGVYQRGVQPATFTLKDFMKARIDAENKRYEGKGHKVTREGEVTIDGAKGNYLHTTWKDGGKDMEKHTAQHLKDGHRYLVVMSGEKGKVDKKLFDEAVQSFALARH